MGTALPSPFNGPPKTISWWIPGRCIRPCSDWNGRASSSRSGAPPSSIAAHVSTTSRAQAERSSRRKPESGHGWCAPSDACWNTRTSRKPDVFRRRRTRLDDEVESHLAQETADNIARVMDPAAARSAAMRAFGNVEAAKETVRELDPLYWADTLWQDIRFAIRLIARSRWLSATIVAALTVGIAINVSVFSLLNGFFLRPWVHSEPGTFVSVIPRYSGKYSLRYSDYA